MGITTNAEVGPPWLVPRSAYVHIPFCAHHCGYCDFAVTAGQDRLIDAYLDGLDMEISRDSRIPNLQLRTLFLGGGTPSHLSVDQLDRLFTTLHRHFKFEPDAEISLEANPDSFDVQKAKRLAEYGVNRISLGVQSFQAHVLRVLERHHEPTHVAPAVAAAKQHLGRVSLDLIFGVPGQSLDGWAADLRHALALEPEQISTYGLTFEKGTRLWKQWQRRELLPLAEDLELAMYRLAMETLEGAGYEQYEISSFARPGACCRHNHVYWANEACLGFGVGAAAYVNGTRTLNTRSTADYIRKASAGESLVFQSETLDPEDRARETMAVNLRRAAGIERGRFREQTTYELDALTGLAVQRHVQAGLLLDDGSRVFLTREGRCVADSIFRDIL